MTGLTTRDYKTIESILAKYPAIKVVHIFGSRAKGSFNTGSDIDLAIMNNGVSDLDLLHLKSDLDDSSLPYFVDVIDYPSLKHQELKQHIDRVGKVFYEARTSLATEFTSKYGILTILFSILLACSQASDSNKPKLTDDFFYGAWGDSVNQQNGGKGIIFGIKRDFYIIWNGNISGGENFKKNLRLTYKLHFDNDPIRAEIISTYLDTDSVNTIKFATIEVIDSTHLIWKLLDDNGKAIDSSKLTKASNKEG